MDGAAHAFCACAGAADARCHDEADATDTRAVGRDRADARQRAVQPGRRRDRGPGLRRDRSGRGRGGTAVGGRSRAGGRRPAPAALLHRGPVAAGAGARGGLRHHEPLAVHRDRPHRPRAGRDPGVPRPAGRRPGRPGARRTWCARWSRAARWPRSPAPARRRLHRDRPGLLAAASWAGYILLNRTVGRRLPGVQGSAAAAAVSALLYLPVGLALFLRHPPAPGALAYAAGAGVLSSAVLFLADLLALRRVPARFFGLFMSVNPVLAALVGRVVLGQELGWSSGPRSRRSWPPTPPACWPRRSVRAPSTPQRCRCRCRGSHATPSTTDSMVSRCRGGAERGLGGPDAPARGLARFRGCRLTRLHRCRLARLRG
ncbi:EamA family transporter [Streptomyces sp. M19]